MSINPYAEFRKQRAQRKVARKAKRKKDRKARRFRSPSFYRSPEWAAMRYKILVRDGGVCQACGRCAADGYVMNVDHIKPRTKHPELALDPDNLQVLCSVCNKGKGAQDATDWRWLDDEYKSILAE